MKYKNRITSNHGYSFDSRLESALYDLLLLREKAGEITELRVKPNVYLTNARILAIPDFWAIHATTGDSIYFEAKGIELPVWRIKRKLWIYYGPGILEVWKGSYQRPYLHETIYPKG